MANEDAVAVAVNDDNNDVDDDDDYHDASDELINNINQVPKWCETELNELFLVMREQINYCVNLIDM